MPLLPFQKEAIIRMVEFLTAKGAVYNACEMGLGKSLMALKAIEALPEMFHTIIICPAIVRLVWRAEIEKWGYSAASFSVYSYEEATKKIDRIKEQPFNCLLLDEAHKVKNTKALRTKAILGKLWPLAKYKICLSGTPMTQSLADCWTLFSRMAPEDFGDYWRFVQTYTHAKQGPYGWKFEGVRNAEKLKDIINKKFFVRYKKSTVLTQLPPKIWQEIPLDKSYAVEYTVEEQAAEVEYRQKLIAAFAARHYQSIVPPIAVARKIRLQGLKKVDAIADFCKNLLDQDIPVVLFVYHKDVIQKLKEKLHEYLPVTVSGDTSEADRKRAVEKFQGGESNLFLSNIVAGGVGITLTRGSTVVFGELAWNPSDLVQAADRCHRIGQQKSVTCYYFRVEKSIDERLVKIIMDKAKTFEKVLN